MKKFLAIALVGLVSTASNVMAQIDADGHLMCRSSFKFSSVIHLDETQRECDLLIAKCLPTSFFRRDGQTVSSTYKGDTTNGILEYYTADLPIKVPGSTNSNSDIFFDITYWTYKSGKSPYIGVSLNMLFDSDNHVNVKTYVYGSDMRGEYLLGRGHSLERKIYRPKNINYHIAEYPDAVLEEVVVRCHREE